MIFKLLLLFLLFWTAQAWPRRTFRYFQLFWTAQAWPRRTFGYFGLHRRGQDALSAIFGLRRRAPDSLSADQLLFGPEQAWPRRTFGYFGLSRPRALMFGRTYLSGLGAPHASHAILQLNMIFKFLLLFWTAQAWPRRTFAYFGLRRRGST